MLPLRCDPIPGESLNGFLVRLAERNGRTSPLAILDVEFRYLFPTLGLSASEMGAVARLSGRSKAELAPLCAEILEGSHDGAGLPLLRYQGAVVSSFDLLKRPRVVCPGCLAEEGFHRAQWDFLAVGACSRHGTELLTRCPSGDHGITWTRCGTTHCGCGEDLRTGSVGPARSDRLDVTAYVEAAISGEVPAEPVLLSGLTLRRAIALMLLLGGLRLDRPPWRVGYTPRDPVRHDVISLGFALAHARLGDLLDLLGPLPDMFAREATMAAWTRAEYGWMGEEGSEDVRALGNMLLEMCVAGEATRPPICGRDLSD